MKEKVDLNRKSAADIGVDIIVCDKCQSTFFDAVFLLRKVSKIDLRSSGQDQIVPIPTFKCANCGNIPEYLNPLAKENDSNDSNIIL